MEIDLSEERSATPLLARLNARGFRLLMVADALALFLTMSVVTALWIYAFAPRGLTGSLPQYGAAFAVYTVIFLATYYFGGAYERELRLGQRAALPQITSLSLGPWLLIGLVELVSTEYFIPRAMLPVVLVVVVLFVTANRYIARGLRR